MINLLCALWTKIVTQIPNNERLGWFQTMVNSPFAAVSKHCRMRTMLAPLLLLRMNIVKIFLPSCIMGYLKNQSKPDQDLSYQFEQPRQCRHCARSAVQGSSSRRSVDQTLLKSQTMQDDKFGWFQSLVNAPSAASAQPDKIKTFSTILSSDYGAGVVR